MKSTVKVITELTNEVITLQEAKTHCDIDLDYTDQDSYIQALIRSTRQVCEKYTSRSFGPKTLEMILDDFPDSDRIVLRKYPVTALTSIKYKDSAGVEYTFSADNYVLVEDVEPPEAALKYGLIWPIFIPYPAGAVRIRYTAGYAAGSLPEPIKHAMLILIRELYDNRSDSAEKQAYKALLTHEHLLNPYCTEFFGGTV